MRWVNKAYAEASKLASADISWANMPRWVKFRICLMNIIYDWVSWYAVKNGWPMLRMRFKQWKFYRKYPELKKFNG